MEFLTAEFLSLVGSSLVGFLFRSNAERRKEQAEVFNRIIEANKASNENYDSAKDRVSISAGKWVRRGIVVTILFGTIMAPFLLPFFEIPTVVEIEETKRQWWDIFGLAGTFTTTTLEPVDGYLLLKENRQILISIVGFYFGNAVAANRA
jgi:hypothetical protein|tara:strand:- start:757 stop:1206 length:450 start_codon:yes stop_codon:yes gene_type:complete